MLVPVAARKHHASVGDPIAINEPAPYMFGQQITFTINTTEEWPWIQNVCFQNGNLVYEEWRGMYPGYPSPGPFVLGPTNNWQGGAADCEARLVIFGGGTHVLATVAYAVVG